MSRMLPHLPLALLLLCGAGIISALAPCAGALPVANSAPSYLASLAAAFVLYGIAALVVTRRAGECRGRAGLLLVLGIALAARLALVAAVPTLSTDLFRYLWDGKVSLAGHNPYVLPPNAPALRPLRGPYWERINFRATPTPYPPVAQGIFCLAAWLRPDDPLTLKLLLLVADVGAIAVLLALLRRVGRPPASVLLYAWNPLVITETSLSGHADVLGIALFLAALLALEPTSSRARALGAVALGLSLAAKPYALVALPLIARWRGTRVVAGALAASALTFLPYLGAGPQVMGGAQAMLARWRGNGSLYEVAVRALAPYTGTPDTTARLLLGSLLALWCLLLARRPIGSTGDLWRRLHYAFLAALLAGPLVLPWYVLWLAPFLCLAPLPAGFAFSVLVSLRHLPGTMPPTGTARLWLEYAPIYALLAWEAARFLIRRWPPPTGSGAALTGRAPGKEPPP